jgi:hypothetical protein
MTFRRRGVAVRAGFLGAIRRTVPASTADTLAIAVHQSHTVTTLDAVLDFHPARRKYVGQLLGDVRGFT